MIPRESITNAFLQCPGIGQVRHEILKNSGIRSWRDAIERPGEIPFGWRAAIVDECHRCERALADSDVAYFVDRFAPADKWRILSHFFKQTSFFDIETTGLEYDAPISVIVCWHKGELHTFVEHENLDDFLDLLDDVTLITSFNGSSFDVPRVLDTFHIPQLPCPHLDLRWLCYHHGYRGGLKQITRKLGIKRPDDLSDVDGELAVELWSRWYSSRDAAAKDLLIRYCSADVLLTRVLGQRLAGYPLQENLWANLGGNDHTPPERAQQQALPGDGSFGAASPLRLRGWRRVS